MLKRINGEKFNLKILQNCFCRDLRIPLYRGVGDGGLPSDEEDRLKLGVISLVEEEDVGKEQEAEELPDSDFDDFDSNDEEVEEEQSRAEDQSLSMSNSRNNEIEEIYYQEKQVLSSSFRLGYLQR